ncbi:MAG: DUF366 family protein [Deltaproteobacteria bacterium]|nr:DUF366 family protein [Deltaproteobacteria bacterium]
MHTLWIPETILYDGAQLRPHWILEQTGAVGDAIAAFVGPAKVTAAHMVDWEDVRAQAWIHSDAMLHFIVEHFETDLTRMILWQRLLVAICHDVLRSHCPAISIRREGDDLFDGVAKLSVSIATVSPISSLIHTGINVLNTNTPVPTRGLQDYDIAAAPFAKDVMDRYAVEFAEVQHARAKVRPVGLELTSKPSRAAQGQGAPGPSNRSVRSCT